MVVRTCKVAVVLRRAQACEDAAPHLMSWDLHAVGSGTCRAADARRGARQSPDNKPAVRR